MMTTAWSRHYRSLPWPSRSHFFEITTWQIHRSSAVRWNGGVGMRSPKCSESRHSDGVVSEERDGVFEGLFVVEEVIL